MFTPTGVNIYSRTNSLPRDKLDEIIASVRKLTNPDVAAIAPNFFDVLHDM
jgi:hypothetical protein